MFGPLLKFTSGTDIGQTKPAVKALSSCDYDNISHITRTMMFETFN